MSSQNSVKNNNSILFLYEGYTEGEFYEKLFNLKIPKRSIRIKKKNLEGIYNINKKVANDIDTHLAYSKDENEIHVIIAMDREASKSTPPNINLKLIKDTFSKYERIKSIELIVATKDLESWLFIDIENIYKFLGVRPTKSDLSKYKLYENFNNVDLSKLFRKHGRIYQKRKRVDKFIDHLDLEKIYNNCPDLKNGIQKIINLCL